MKVFQGAVRRVLAALWRGCSSTPFSRSAPPSNDHPGLFPHQIICAMIGCLLVAAAGLKFQALIASARLHGVPSFGIQTAKQTLPISFEGWLGVWLLLARSVFWPARVALGTFILFSSLASYKVLTGDESCGCFGDIALNPKYVLAFDVAVVVILVHLFAGVSTHVSSVVGTTLRRVAALVVVAISIGHLHRHWPTSATSAGTDLETVHDVLVEPKDLVGKTFALNRYVDHGSQLLSGDWIVAFYGSRCSACREALPHYEQLGRLLSKLKDAPRLALVEVPPFSGSPARAAAGAHYLFARLTDSKRWLVPIPTAIRLAVC